MKAVHITLSYGGGLQTAINQFVNNSKVEHQQVVTFGKEDRFRKNETFEGILYEGLLQSIVKTLEAEIVFVHSTKAGIIRPLLKLFGKHVIYVPHSLYFSRDDLNPLVKKVAKLLEWLLSYFTDRYLLLGWHEARELIRLGGNIHYNIISNIPPSSKFEPANIASTTNEDSKKYVVLCGRIHHQKSPLKLLDLIPAINARGYKIIWVGDGDPELRARLIDSGVEVTGWIDPVRVKQYIQSSTFVLHLASAEGLPIIFFEAWKYANSRLLCINNDYAWFIPKKYKFDGPLQFQRAMRQAENAGFFDNLKKVFDNRFDPDKSIKHWAHVVESIEASLATSQESA